jgi:uncharacterized membrane protein
VGSGVGKLKRLNTTLPTALPYLLVIAGIIGLIASFILTYDKIQVLRNPDYTPPCNINPIFSCGSVMKTEQASLFGVPNTIFGLMGFTALITLGFVVAAGAVLKQWIWVVAQATATLGVVFMHYLFFQGVFRIHAICPWCFVIWMITIPVFWYLTLYNLRQSNIRLPRSLRKLNMFLQANHGNILLVWYAVIFLILLFQFWDFWITLIP